MFTREMPNAFGISLYVAGFPDHPPRGFETVSYVLADKVRHEKVRHEDSKDPAGVIIPHAQDSSDNN